LCIINNNSNNITIIIIIITNSCATNSHELVHKERTLQSSDVHTPLGLSVYSLFHTRARAHTHTHTHTRVVIKHTHTHTQTHTHTHTHTPASRHPHWRHPEKDGRHTRHRSCVSESWLATPVSSLRAQHSSQKRHSCVFGDAFSAFCLAPQISPASPCRASPGLVVWELGVVVQFSFVHLGRATLRGSTRVLVGRLRD
jgi:hypothetical protein